MNKGTLKIVKGDATNPQLKDNEIAIIPHVCNHIGAWGSGFVMALSKKWKEPEEQYRKYINDNKIHNINPEFLLGSLASNDEGLIRVQGSIHVANMIAQSGVRGNTDYDIPLRYLALGQCMDKVRMYAEGIQESQSYLLDKNIKCVMHCPKFGSDLAGGDWNIIQNIFIKQIWLDNGLDVVVYEFK